MDSLTFAAAATGSSWLLSILGGLALIPISIGAGIAIAYGILYLRRVREFEGRRGFLAILYGILFGTPSGFYLGFSIARACLGADTQTLWPRAILSGLVSLLGASVAFLITFVSGVHLAEARHVTNYAGERTAWSLFYFALPITFLVAAALFAGAWFWLDRAFH